MSETFGRRINRFVLALDIVDEDLFNQVRDLMLDYIKKESAFPANWNGSMRSGLSKICNDG